MNPNTLRKMDKALQKMIKEQKRENSVKASGGKLVSDNEYKMLELDRRRIRKAEIHEDDRKTLIDLALDMNDLEWAKSIQERGNK